MIHGINGTKIAIGPSHVSYALVAQTRIAPQFATKATKTFTTGGVKCRDTPKPGVPDMPTSTIDPD